MQHAQYPVHRHADLSRPPAILPAQTSSHHAHAHTVPDAYRLHSSPMVPMASTNAIAGPSSLSASPSTNLSPGTHGDAARKKNGATVNGKKRRATADESEDSGTPNHSKSREGPKKKKAARACFHCQKAHLTCDDSRPCQRCVKRGMAEKCTEGHRKKAKYLLDDAEIEALKKGKPPAQNTPEAVQPTPPPPGPVAEPFPPNDLYFGLPLDQGYSFGSEAANLEYSSLSAILGLTNLSPDDQPFLGDTPSSATSNAFNQPFANAAWPSEPQQPQPNVSPQALLGGYDSGYGAGMLQQQQPMQPNGQSQYGPQPLFGGPTVSTISPQQNGFAQEQQLTMPQRTPSEAAYPTPELTYNSVQAQQMQTSPTQPHSSQQSYVQPSPPVVQNVSPPQQQQRSSQPLQPQPQVQRLPQMAAPTSASAPPAMNRVQNTSAASIVSPPSTDSPMSTGSVNENVIIQQNGTGYQAESQIKLDVYNQVVKAYDYTESYHFLMKFLPTRFEKNDILRVIRALAIYRPSIIALQTPMSEDDFIFMEKCLLRSLVELEKLISFSGTPTVVWRRTGEICLVGQEFCLLTEWKKSELTTGRKYIYELFENQSVIEYWEKFALHAFENTTQSVFSHCVLLKPSGETIPCTFCFSIRRDLFDLPSLVIGQWLPLL